MLRSNLAAKILSLAIALVLAGCNLPEPKENKESDGSTFAVTSFEGKVNSKVLNQKTGLPSSNIYNYKACLTDLRQKKPMIGNKFEISETGQNVATDANGCVTWTETVEYNYLAASKYLKFTRTIKGLGPHFGTQSVSFAIDPWSHGDANPKDAIDLSKNKLPDDLLLQDKEDVKMSLMGVSARQKKSPSQLWVNMSRLAAVEDRITGKGFEINYDFQTTPQLKLNKMTGEQTFTDLTSGTVNGKVQLIHVVLKDGKMVRTVLTAKDFPNVQISNKILAMSAHYNFKAEYTGHLYLAVQLTPTNELADLAPFEGLFYLGDYRSVNSGGFLLLSGLVQKNPNFTIEQFLAGKYPIDTETETAPSKTPGETSARGVKEDFIGKNLVGIPALTFGTPRIEQDSGHRRVLKFRMTGCLINPVSQQPIRGVDIKITPLKISETEATRTPENVTSQIDGCVSWDDHIDVHDAYGCQKFMKGSVGLQNADWGIDRKINVFINPYDDSFQVGADELLFRNALGRECDGAKSLEKPSYLFAAGIQYNLMKVDHNIDPNLNISVTRHMQMDLDLTVVNNSKLHGPRDGTERLRDALYLVRSVITEDPDHIKTPRFITHSSSIVQSSAGHITVRDASFKFLNLLDMGNRNRLLFQVLPVDRSKVRIKHSVSNVSEQLKDIDAFEPNAGLTEDDVVDKSLRLLPVIYDAKIIMMGGESLRTNLVDIHKNLMVAVMDGKTEYQTAFTKLIEERKTLMTNLVAQGLAKEKEEQQKITEKSSVLDYARRLSTVLVNVNEPASKNFQYFQKLLNLDIKEFNRNAFGFRNLKTRENLAESVALAKPLTKAQVMAALGAPLLSKDMEKRLCIYLITELIPSAFKKGDDTLDAALQCVDPVQTMALLTREKIYHVNKFTKNAEYFYGKYENLALSNSFAQSYGFTSSTAHTTSTSMGAKVPDFFIFSIGGQTTVSATKQHAESTSNTVTLTTTLPLSYQTGVTMMTLQDYEVCYHLRLNKDLFIEKKGLTEIFNFKKLSLYGLLDLKKPYADIFETLNRGVLVCERPEVMKPVTNVKESFFVIQQEPKESELQDKGDVKNRGFFMTIRGQDQFHRFQEMAKSEVSLPKGYRLGDLDSEQVNDHLKNAFTFRPWSPRIYVVPSAEK